MKARFFALPALILVTRGVDAQQDMVRVSGGEVARNRTAPMDESRLTRRISGVAIERRQRIHVTGDSAQRIAMHDYEWRGRVNSVELDEEDERLFWDVKIVPDAKGRTIVRYRVDAASGGILGIREFTGIRGLAIRKP